uniref:Uncharacterized protein n=1 Tax=Knipowitschia caucasica TaxID=637954 RepID=A0AAV2KT84_KNICA
MDGGRGVCNWWGWGVWGVAKEWMWCWGKVNGVGMGISGWWCCGGKDEKECIVWMGWWGWMGMFVIGVNWVVGFDDLNWCEWGCGCGGMDGVFVGAWGGVWCSWGEVSGGIGMAMWLGWLIKGMSGGGYYGMWYEGWGIWMWVFVIGRCVVRVVEGWGLGYGGKGGEG